jgi:hypothetical protein
VHIISGGEWLDNHQVRVLSNRDRADLLVFAHKIQTTLDLYTQEDSDATRAAQGEFLSTAGMNATVN